MLVRAHDVGQTAAKEGPPGGSTCSLRSDASDVAQGGLEASRAHSLRLVNNYDLADRAPARFCGDNLDNDDSLGKLANQASTQRRRIQLRALRNLQDRI